jgi:hypothetical protein
MIERQTIRQFLAARKRKLFVVLIVCWLGAFGSMGMGVDKLLPPPWFAIALVTLGGGAVAAIFGIWFFIRCPRCKGVLGTNNAPLLRDWLMFGRRINFCPYCGVSLDEPYENHRTSRDSIPLA